ncbi:FmdB family transcriptional regulator [Trebonia kvetii]|uniref:FmdB family transcriptional regulator n=1 Tax=Trebonia kvetii TaxID=2480626 RepID=A0A6P2BYM7_9ACTN|nr:FmdB family zinc ribbon protein [Trebonia kvetii]TVZ04030.1 FmdB family transcriptional regulator [Trebonia kvetii]
MPTYQYACTECGGQLEAVQKFTDEPLTVHEDCGGRLRKVFSPVGIVFKGSGFYRTDSRGSGSSSGTSSSAAAAAKDSGSSSAGSADSSSSSSSSASGGEKATASASSTASSGSSSGEKVA